MEAVDLRLRGLRPGRALVGLLVFLASAALSLLACVTVQDPGASRAARSSAEAALDLYEAGEYTLAAERFADASREPAHTSQSYGRSPELTPTDGECPQCVPQCDF